MRKSDMGWCSRLANIAKPSCDDDCFSVVSAAPACAAIPALSPNSMPSPGKQCSYPHANLNQPAFRPGQQTGRETNIKKVSELATCTLNSKGHRDRTVIAYSDEPNSLADTVDPPRKIFRTVPTIGPTIIVEQDRLHWEANQSPLPIVRLSLPDSPSRFASNLREDLAAAASEQIPMEASAQHLVMLASGAR